MTVNPYSPPSDASEPDSESTLLVRGDAGQFRIYEFKLDASIAGIRSQRASSRHAVFDALMITGSLFLLLFCALLWSSTLSLVCVVMPIWLCMGTAWLANLSFRRGDDFAVTCPGLIGNIHGRFSMQQVEVRGPSICMAGEATRKQVRVSGRGITIKVPGTEQVLKIRSADIVQVVDSDDGRWWDDAGIGLLGESDRQHLTSDNVVIGERQLHGRDLVGLSPHHRWRTQTMITGAFAGLALLGTFLVYLQIPPLVFGYDRFDLKRMPYENMILAVYGLAFCSVPLAAFFIRMATKPYRSQGTYNIVVSPDLVSVARIKQNDRAGLCGAGLTQVCWNDRGLNIVGKKNRLLFLMPVRWFDEQQRMWLADHFGSETSPVIRDCYFGPRLG